MISADDISQLIDKIEDPDSVRKLIEKLFPGDDDSAPTQPPIDDAADAVSGIELLGPQGQPAPEEQGDALLPTFDWRVSLPPGEVVQSIKLFVSVEPPKQGLLPEDRPPTGVIGKDKESLYLRPNSIGDLQDINPNRILTRKFEGADLASISVDGTDEFLEFRQLPNG